MIPNEIAARLADALRKKQYEEPHGDPCHCVTCEALTAYDAACKESGSEWLDYDHDDPSAHCGQMLKSEKVAVKKDICASCSQYNVSCPIEPVSPVTTCAQYDADAKEPVELPCHHCGRLVSASVDWKCGCGRTTRPQDLRKEPVRVKVLRYCVDEFEGMLWDNSGEYVKVEDLKAQGIEVSDA